jgi:hypothetical protein
MHVQSEQDMIIYLIVFQVSGISKLLNSLFLHIYCFIIYKSQRLD